MAMIHVRHTPEPQSASCAPLPLDPVAELVPVAVRKRLSYYRATTLALAYAREHLTETIRLDEVAATVGLSRAAFSRLFNEKVGMTFFALLRVLRVERAIEILARRDCPVTLLARETGYQNASTFARVFKSVIGQTPSEYRRRLLSRS